MFLTEYDQDKVLEQERRDSERRGERRGFTKGFDQAREQTAKTMLMDGKPLGEIIKYSCLAEDVIRGIAEKIGAAIA